MTLPSRTGTIAPSIRKVKQGDTPPIFVRLQNLGTDLLAESQSGEVLLGPGTKRLPLFRRIDAMQSELDFLPILEQPDGIPIRDTHNPTRPGARLEKGDEQNNRAKDSEGTQKSLPVKVGQA